MKKDWQDYVFDWRVRFGLPALIFVVVTLAVLKYIYSRPVVFESNAKIWIQTKGNYSNQQGISPYFNSPISTAAEVMKSSVVLSQAVKELTKVLPAGDVPSAAALRAVRVNPIAETDVLEISYQHGKPQVAYEVVKAMVNAFVQVSTAQSAASAVQSREFIQRKLDSTRKQHDELVKAVRDFQQSSGTIDVEDEKSGLMTELSGLKGQLLDAQLEVGSLDSRIKSLSDQLGVSTEVALAAEKISQDTLVQQMKAKLSDYQMRLIEARTRFSDDSPRIVRLKKSIEKTEASIDERIRSLGGTVKADVLPTEAADKRARILEAISEARHDQAVARRKMVELQSHINSISAQLQTIPAAQSKFADLTREEKVIADRISQAESNLSDAQLNESLARESSSVEVIDMPELANQPESANGKKIFVIAESLLLSFCLVLCYLLHFLDPHLRSPKRLLRVLPVPIGGWVEKDVYVRSSKLIPVLNRFRLSVEKWVGQEPIAIISAGEGDGKTSVACGLAMSYLSSGKRVMLIDANFLAPTIHKLFDLAQSPGLSDFVNSEHPDKLGSFIKEPRANLFVLPSGTSDDQCFLEGHKLREVLEVAKSKADVVIFDTAAINKSDSSLALFSQVRCALIAVRLGHTRLTVLRSLAARISGLETEFLSVLTNSAESEGCAATLERSNAEKLAEVSATW